MTKKDKLNDIMIAEFMGAKIIEKENHRIVCDFPKKSGLDWWLDYDTKWDWLMPVLDTIQNQGCVISLGMNSLGKTASISLARIDVAFEYQANTLIEAVYKCVVDYVKWYKSQTCLVF